MTICFRFNISIIKDLCLSDAILILPEFTALDNLGLFTISFPSPSTCLSLSRYPADSLVGPYLLSVCVVLCAEDVVMCASR